VDQKDCAPVPSLTKGGLARMGVLELRGSKKIKKTDKNMIQFTWSKSNI